MAGNHPSQHNFSSIELQSSMFFWPTTLYDHDHFLFKKICIIFKIVRSLHRIWPIESIITAIIKQTPTKTINKI
ncbi:hypothetical protein AU769_21340, partial [Salmonella enterica subsp. enterica serovar Curacao]|nr:hypothetical protein [Salmonella enterica subsp. enterica serovar Curacao]